MTISRGFVLGQGPISALPLLSPKGPGAAADAFFNAQSAPAADAHSFECTAPCLLPAYSEARSHLPNEHIYRCPAHFIEVCSEQ